MENKGQNSTNINWFPGHMTRAKRDMSEKMNMVDMVIELRDARIPNASKNPLLEELIQQKPRLIILSKKDKADPALTKDWIQFLKKDDTEALALDIPSENIINPVTDAVKRLMKAKIDKMKERGMKPRPMRAMVVGIPNVGKSTFINRLAKKKIAQTGDRPGVTRALQWVKVNRDIDVLDTPGVLWPKFDDERCGMLLAITGAIRDEILPIDMHEDPYVVFQRIAEKRKYCRSRNEMDEKRTFETFLKELRDDKLGRMTWETPDADSK